MYPTKLLIRYYVDFTLEGRLYSSSSSAIISGIFQLYLLSFYG